MIKRKYAVIMPSGYVQGSELCIYETIKALSAQQISVSVFFPKDGPIIKKMKAYSASTHILFYEWWATIEKLSILRKVKFLARCFESALKIGKICKKENIDTIISSTLTVPQGALAALIYGKKHIWYIHEFGEEDHGLFFLFGRKFSCYLIGKLSHTVVVNSKVTYEKFKVFIPEKKIKLVYYAVDMPRVVFTEPDLERGYLKIIMIGRMAPGKRQEDAINAIAILQGKGIKTKLELIGGSNAQYLQFLKDLTVKLKIAEHVEFVDFVEAPFLKIKQSDVALVCSLKEAFGRVTIEAMKMGTPVIASDTGASPEIIKDGWNGLLYRCTDGKDLADKIEKINDDPQLRMTIARNAYEWAWNNFNLEKHSSDFSAAIQ